MKQLKYPKKQKKKIIIIIKRLFLSFYNGFYMIMKSAWGQSDISSNIKTTIFCF